MKATAKKVHSTNQARRSPSGSVESLTPSVKQTVPNPGRLRQAQEAIAAADIYLARLIPALGEASLALRCGQSAAGSDVLSNSVAGIRFLAELLEVIGRSTGIDSAPAADQEIGQMALCLHEIASAQAQNRTELVVDIIDQRLVPALHRLAPTLADLENRITAIA